MTPTNTCPTCGSDLPGDAPEGLCPRCLMSAGLITAPTLARSSEAATIEPIETRTINPAAGVRVRYFGDYELLEEIARGGMGVVYKARQVSLNRTVALKMILAGHLASDAERQRFRTEAKAAANLQHPNIVAIHEVGEYQGQQYFSMDYVEGKTLGALAQERRLSPKRAAEYVKTIAEAIHFAHQRGTLHRDLKPLNVLIDEHDQPRITDFGLAKQVGQPGEATRDGTIMGSPSYMPPEQAAGRVGDIGPHSDVYSLGALLYELLTGRPPFRGETPMATLRRVMEDEPVPPRKISAEVPPDLETVCLKCLEKSPGERYHSARDLAEELGRFLNQEPIVARPASVLRKAESWARRNPWAITAVAMLALLALSCVADYLFEQNRFLSQKQLTPTLARAKGPLTDALENRFGIGLLDVAVGLSTPVMLTWFYVLFQARGGKEWSELFATGAVERPISPRLRAFAICLGGVGMSYGALLLAKVVEAYVWEAYDLSLGLGAVYGLWWASLMCAGSTIQNYRRFAYGGAASGPAAEPTEAHGASMAARRLDPGRLGAVLLAEIVVTVALVRVLPLPNPTTLLVEVLGGWAGGLLMGLFGMLKMDRKRRSVVVMYAGLSIAGMTLLLMLAVPFLMNAHLLPWPHDDFFATADARLAEMSITVPAGVMLGFLLLRASLRWPRRPVVEGTSPSGRRSS